MIPKDDKAYLEELRRNIPTGEALVHAVPFLLLQIDKQDSLIRDSQDAEKIEAALAKLDEAAHVLNKIASCSESDYADCPSIANDLLKKWEGT